MKEVTPMLSLTRVIPVENHSHIPVDYWCMKEDIHVLMKYFTCDMCGKTFVYSGDLMRLVIASTNTSSCGDKACVSGIVIDSSFFRYFGGVTSAPADIFSFFQVSYFAS